MKPARFSGHQTYVGPQKPAQPSNVDMQQQTQQPTSSESRKGTGSEKLREKAGRKQFFDKLEVPPLERECRLHARALKDKRAASRAYLREQIPPMKMGAE